MPGRVMVVEEVAQTVFRVNMPDRDRSILVETCLDESQWRKR